jgi:S-adenosylmethionine:tRNA ribosyltransferase-isomerase
MKLSDFVYDLPEELIAQTPTEPRDHSRLMVLDRANDTILHKRFYDVADYFNPGDVMVINDTKVIPARLLGHRLPGGGACEVFLLKQLAPKKWETLVRPGKRLRPGQKVSFGDGLLTATIRETTDAGGRVVDFQCEGTFEAILDRLGEMPLPPYIHEKLADANRYQTVYAKQEGSAAAPTAGLHFTPELLERIKAKGITVVPVLLHVGLGTFRPVKVENAEEHVMHSEFCQVTEEAAETLNRIRRSGGRIVCVGTTSVRTLETMATEDGIVHAGARDTAIFIYPGVKIKAVDALITNFHLPQSTLLMLVSALTGRDEALRVYREAVQERYRFFSFGDAMFIE